MTAYANAQQSAAWLRERMGEFGIATLDELAESASTDKGNLSRIFRKLQRPRVDSLEPLVAALDASVYERFVRIGAVALDR